MTSNENDTCHIKYIGVLNNEELNVDDYTYKKGIKNNYLHKNIGILNTCEKKNVSLFQRINNKNMERQYKYMLYALKTLNIQDIKNDDRGKLKNIIKNLHYKQLINANKNIKDDKYVMIHNNDSLYYDYLSIFFLNNIKSERKKKKLDANLWSRHANNYDKIIMYVMKHLMKRKQKKKKRKKKETNNQEFEKNNLMKKIKFIFFEKLIKNSNQNELVKYVFIMEYIKYMSDDIMDQIINQISHSLNDKTNRMSNNLIYSEKGDNVYRNKRINMMLIPDMEHFWKYFNPNDGNNTIMDIKKAIKGNLEKIKRMLIQYVCNYSKIQTSCYYNDEHNHYNRRSKFVKSKPFSNSCYNKNNFGNKLNVRDILSVKRNDNLKPKFKMLKKGTKKNLNKNISHRISAEYYNREEEKKNIKYENKIFPNDGSRIANYLKNENGSNMKIYLYPYIYKDMMNFLNAYLMFSFEMLINYYVYKNIEHRFGDRYQKNILKRECANKNVSSNYSTNHHNINTTNEDNNLNCNKFILVNKNSFACKLLNHYIFLEKEVNGLSSNAMDISSIAPKNIDKVNGSGKICYIYQLLNNLSWSNTFYSNRLNNISNKYEIDLIHNKFYYDYCDNFIGNNIFPKKNSYVFAYYKHCSTGGSNHCSSDGADANKNSSGGNSNEHQKYTYNNNCNDGGCNNSSSSIGGNNGNEGDKDNNNNEDKNDGEKNENEEDDEKEEEDNEKNEENNKEGQKDGNNSPHNKCIDEHENYYKLIKEIENLEKNESVNETKNETKNYEVLNNYCEYNNKIKSLDPDKSIIGTEQNYIEKEDDINNNQLLHNTSPNMGHPLKLPLLPEMSHPNSFSISSPRSPVQCGQECNIGEGSSYDMNNCSVINFNTTNGSMQQEIKPCSGKGSPIQVNDPDFEEACDIRLMNNAENLKFSQSPPTSSLHASTLHLTDVNELVLSPTQQLLYSNSPIKSPNNFPSAGSPVFDANYSEEHMEKVASNYLASSPYRHDIFSEYGVLGSFFESLEELESKSDNSETGSGNETFNYNFSLNGNTEDDNNNNKSKKGNIQRDEVIYNFKKNNKTKVFHAWCNKGEHELNYDNKKFNSVIDWINYIEDLMSNMEIDTEFDEKNNMEIGSDNIGFIGNTGNGEGNINSINNSMNQNDMIGNYYNPEKLGQINMNNTYENRDISSGFVMNNNSNINETNSLIHNNADEYYNNERGDIGNIEEHSKGMDGLSMHVNIIEGNNFDVNTFDVGNYDQNNFNNYSQNIVNDQVDKGNIYYGANNEGSNFRNPLIQYGCDNNSNIGNNNYGNNFEGETNLLPFYNNAEDNVIYNTNEQIQQEGNNDFFSNFELNDNKIANGMLNGDIHDTSGFIWDDNRDNELNNNDDPKNSNINSVGNPLGMVNTEHFDSFVDSNLDRG
ncbi:conserved Plasmodium protein, unknown function [Plasmodium berghei]|uniref:Uncharacterized protein n=2 Tax=Plasmodium berghei TaxID=5821 RepID=A0A509ATH1_PLABA|nr:conserved Plasmodium protein, unknown function [Plasmodium berghei ANKA]CXJ03791.1 conserved Plasmodium protein, unknown function [Plasmodium berghei]SCL98548.1 conserved Plasmodium protein, unknown function [Plasmodium berghei]SCM16851.1 conserved Plasmodium protein, unknown function [Plasmodium berghei]SCM18649.1 conserved Plasmodium protein, unknown function [Plasmodium berghei]SCN28084.1 conserved Plasmodium protein, unknown function [Plasmodium berghei]|eukprot:XP_034423734.1 conserved Plasmodium protein, unknown function [Plasmodium berghei ANKA]